MVPVCSSVMLELVLTVHSYHVIAYPVHVCAINMINKDFFPKAFQIQGSPVLCITVPSISVMIMAALNVKNVSLSLTQKVSGFLSR